MKAFLWAVLACIVISTGASYIFQDDGAPSTRVAEGVRLDPK